MKPPSEKEMRSLLDLWKEEVVRKLEAEAIAAIRPKLLAAAQAVVAEMEPELRSHYSYSEREFALYLCMQDKSGVITKIFDASRRESKS